eukprot:121545-Rhodomonas_salina.2
MSSSTWGTSSAEAALTAILAPVYTMCRSGSDHVDRNSFLRESTQLVQSRLCRPPASVPHEISEFQSDAACSERTRAAATWTLDRGSDPCNGLDLDPQPTASTQTATDPRNPHVSMQDAPPHL